MLVLFSILSLFSMLLDCYNHIKDDDNLINLSRLSRLELHNTIKCPCVFEDDSKLKLEDDDEDESNNVPDVVTSDDDDDDTFAGSYKVKASNLENSLNLNECGNDSENGSKSKQKSKAVSNFKTKLKRKFTDDDIVKALESEEDSLNNETDDVADNDTDYTDEFVLNDMNFNDTREYEIYGKVDNSVDDYVHVNANPGASVIVVGDEDNLEGPSNVKKSRKL